MATCHPGGYAEGVAVDKHGNVSLPDELQHGVITEYAGGPSGRNGTNLSVPGGVGGMVIDKHSNIVIAIRCCDVDVIARLTPP